MSITEERKQKVDFTEKYYQTPARFVAKKGADRRDHARKALAGKKVGVQRATTHDSFLTDNFGDVGRGRPLRAPRTRPISISSPAGSTCCSADSVDAERGPAQDRPGQGLRVRRPGLLRPEVVRPRRRHRDPQGRHRPARQAQRGDRRDPRQRHLGQDRGQVLRLRRLRQLTCRAAAPRHRPCGAVAASPGKA